MLLVPTLYAMKIALVIKQFDAARGGAEHWTWQYAHWLLAQGHEVHVVASGFAEGGGAPGTMPRGIVPHVIVPHLVPPLHSPLAWADAAAEAAETVRADVVHDMARRG